MRNYGDGLSGYLSGRSRISSWAFSRNCSHYPAIRRAFGCKGRAQYRQKPSSGRVPVWSNSNIVIVAQLMWLYQTNWCDFLSPNVLAHSFEAASGNVHSCVLLPFIFWSTPFIRPDSPISNAAPHQRDVRCSFTSYCFNGFWWRGDGPRAPAGFHVGAVAPFPLQGLFSSFPFSFSEELNSHELAEGKERKKNKPFPKTAPRQKTR